MKVYVVTCGEYSDYRILAIFSSTDEKAKEYLRVYKASNKYSSINDIEEYVIDEECGVEIHTIFTCVLNYNGSAANKFNYEALVKPNEYPQSSLEPNKLYNYKTAMQFQGRSIVSAEEAFKVAEECRQAYLRETKGNENGPQAK